MQVIDKFLKKAKMNIKILPLFDGEWPPGVRLFGSEGCDPNKEGEGPGSHVFYIEKLNHGYAMLPDVSKFGPMYFCKMQIIGE